MSKGNTFEEDLLRLIFNGKTITGIAQCPTSSPTEFLYVSLHTGDPGETGNQTTNEVGTAAYTGYARQSVRRCTSGGLEDTSGWTIPVGGSSVSPANVISFPESTGGTGANITHFAIGTASGTSAGKILYKGSISPQIAVATGVTPRLTTSSTITED